MEAAGIAPASHLTQVAFRPGCLASKAQLLRVVTGRADRPLVVAPEKPYGLEQLMVRGIP